MSTDPNFYKRSKHFSKNKDVEDIYQRIDKAIQPDKQVIIKEILQCLKNNGISKLSQDLRNIYRERSINPLKKSQILIVYKELLAKGETDLIPGLEKLLIKNPVKVNQVCW